MIRYFFLQIFNCNHPVWGGVDTYCFNTDFQFSSYLDWSDARSSLSNQRKVNSLEIDQTKAKVSMGTQYRNNILKLALNQI